MSKPYNGHPSWNAWNVSLWINNDEVLYRELLRHFHDQRTYGGMARPSKREAALQFMDSHKGEKTPDGAPYTLTNVLRAMVGWGA